MPRGNGIPMKKASGPIKHTEKMILMMSDSIVNREKMKGKNCKYKHVIKDTMPIEKRIGFLCRNKRLFLNLVENRLPSPEKVRKPQNTVATVYIG